MSWTDASMEESAALLATLTKHAEAQGKLTTKESVEKGKVGRVVRLMVCLFVGSCFRTFVGLLVCFFVVFNY